MPTKAQVVLRVCSAATDADISTLQTLYEQYPRQLTTRLLLRIILTYLPESTDPQHYTSLLQSSSHENKNTSSLDDTTDISFPPKDLAKTNLSHLKLVELTLPNARFDCTAEILTTFLILRSHRIEAETGSLTLVKDLISPFVGDLPFLKTWYLSTFLPLYRVNYEYYPEQERIPSLASFEELNGSAAVEAILSLSRDRRTNTLARDFRNVIGPKVFLDQSREQSSSRNEQAGEVDATVAEDDVLAGLLDMATQDLGQFSRLYIDWAGPADIAAVEDLADLSSRQETIRNSASQREYLQLPFAAFYLAESMDEERERTFSTLLARAAALSNVEMPKMFGANVTQPWSGGAIPDSLTPIDCLRNNVLNEANVLTKPSLLSVQLTAYLLRSCDICRTLGHEIAPKTMLFLSCFAQDIDQMHTLDELTSKVGADSASNDKIWSFAQESLFWLRGWGQDVETIGPLGKVPQKRIEQKLLNRMLLAGRYDLAGKTFSIENDEALTTVVYEAALSTFDNAKGANKDSGGMKKTAEILNAFPQMSTDQNVVKLKALIAVCHSLSFYTLKLEHGTPLRPARLRASTDPLGLLDKLLSQNSGSYTNLDDLIKIGQNMYRAGIVQPTQIGSLDDSTAMKAIERLVFTKVIDAALAEGDFDTAYSYIVNRLNHDVQDTQQSTQSELWQCAYNAGKFHALPNRKTSKLRRLEQRMELLSEATLLVPQNQLDTVLETWQKCEAEFNAALAEESHDNTNWQTRQEGSRQLPGGFTLGDTILTESTSRPVGRGRNLETDGPVGLFDVARSAAAALSKSAFPLRQGQGDGNSTLNLSLKRERERGASANANEDGSGQGQGQEETRVRKRDMVSNMVTGGLVSGIGWVIGAPAPGKE